jgi:hypothetical protein
MGLKPPTEPNTVKSRIGFMPFGVTTAGAPFPSFMGGPPRLWFDDGMVFYLEDMFTYTEDPQQTKDRLSSAPSTTPASRRARDIKVSRPLIGPVNHREKYFRLIPRIHHRRLAVWPRSQPDGSKKAIKVHPGLPLLFLVPAFVATGDPSAKPLPFAHHGSRPHCG